MKAVKQRKDEVVQSSREGLEKWLRSMERCTVYQDHARFSAPKQIQAGDETISGEKIFLDLGARAAIPPIRGLENIPYLTNSSMMDVDFLPEHLVIVGSGSVGLEFAQMYRRFGSRVTLIDRNSRVAAGEDDDVAAAIAELLRKEDIELVLNAEIEGIHRKDNGDVAVQLTALSNDEVVGTHLLVATGRRPNTDEMNLESAGVEVDDRGYIKVDDQLQTTADNVWALGDCNGRGAFTHTAYNDFEIVSENLLDEGQRRVSQRIPAYAIYTDPPLGRAGMNKRQARESGKEILIAQMPMSKVGRAKEKGETEGFMEVLIDAKSDKIVGATVLGTGGDEVIHCFLETMYADASYKTMQRAVHIHPTVSELIPTMLGDLAPLNSVASAEASK